VGSLKDGKFIKLPYGCAKGIADLLVMHNGISFFIECKAPNGKQSDDQKKFEAAIRKRGIRYYLVRDVSEVDAIMQEMKTYAQHIQDCLCDQRNH
jgi:hypothetical protein